MSAKKRFIVIGVILFAVLLSAVGVTYAFFAQDVGVDSGKLTLEMDPNNKGVATVNSAYDLKVWARDRYYNVFSPTSDASTRYVLILGNNIVLDEDIVIERDVYLVLNGKQLNLQDHTITVRHGYVSRQLISNERYPNAIPNPDAVPTTPVAENAFGTGKGKMIYETPNAIVTVDESLKRYVGIDGKIDILVYDESRVMKQMTEWITKRVPNGKSYVSDIDLPTAYLGYSYRIEWKSGNTALIDHSGKVYLLELGGNLSEKITLDFCILNAKNEILFNSEEIDPISGKTSTITVILISQTAAEHRFEIGKNFITEYFSRFKATNGDYYNLFLNIGLPSSFQYYGLHFEYRTFAKSSASGLFSDVPTTSVDLKAGDGTAVSPDGEGYVGAENGLYIYWPEGAKELSLQIKIVYQNADGSVNTNNEQAFVFVAVDGNNSNYSQAVLEKIGVIIIDDYADTVIDLLSDEDKIKFNIKSTTYAFVDADGNPSTQYYYVSSDEVTTDENGQQVTQKIDRLHVSKLPSFEEEVYLKMTFEFEGGRPKEITVTSQVFYVDASMGGGTGGADVFAVYHSLLLQEYRKVTNYGETFRTFSLPRKVGKAYVRFYFDENSLDKKPDSSLPDQNSDSEISAYGGRIVLKYSAELATFVLDEKLLNQNLTLSIYLKYSTIAEPGWESVPLYGQKVEEGVTIGTPIMIDLKLLGLLRKGIDVADPNLFGYLSKLVDLDTDGYITIDEITQANLSSMTIKLSTGDSYTKFDSYKGLEFFTQLNELHIEMPDFGDNAADLTAIIALYNLKTLSIINTAVGSQTPSKTAMTAKDTVKFAALPNLVSLTLNNFNFADETVSGTLMQYDFNGNTKLQTLELSNCGLSHLSGLSLLLSLQNLNVSNRTGIQTNENRIRKFAELRNLTLLKKVYLFGNTMSGTADELEFGSGGKFNLSVFTMLTERGVQVYRTSESLLFVPTEWEIEGSYVVEGMFHSVTAKIVSGAISIDVPVKLYIVSGDTNPKYTLSWRLVGQTAPENITANDNYTFTLPAAEGNIFELIVAVTVSKPDGTSVNVEKVIEVRAIL